MIVNFAESSLGNLRLKLYSSGLSLPLSEVLSSNISPDYFQIFYVYLFTGSLAYLAFVYCDLLREK